MKKIVLPTICLCSVLSTFSYAKEGECIGVEDWQFNSKNPVEIYNKHYADPTTEYVAFVDTPACNGKIWVKNKWTDKEIEQSIEYWNSSADKFCVSRLNNEGFSNKLKDVFFIIDGDYHQGTSLKSFNSKLGIAVKEFIDQSFKLYALEELGMFESPVEYPTCE